MGAGRLLDRVRRHRRSLVGLVGAVLLLVAGSTHLAFLTEPYRWDEPPHVGYVLSLRDGVLPTIDTPIEAEGRSVELEGAVERGNRGGFFVPDVYTANNPPLVYLLALPAAELSLRAGLPGGPLLGLRLVDIAGAGIAVGFTYLLGWELSRSRLAAVTAAGFLATGTSLAIVVSMAALDGPALAATTAVTWAMVRCLSRRRLDDGMLLGACCAVAAAVRPMSLAFALVAGAIGALGLVGALGVRRLPAIAARVALPTLVLVGWFYALNVARYGDPTASEALFEKMGFDGTGRSFSSFLFSDRALVDPLGYLVYERYGESFYFFPSETARRAGRALLALVAVGLVAILARWRPRPDAGEGQPAGRHVWLLVAALALLPSLVLAEHYAGGGGEHPRYLLPALPLLFCIVATLVTRIHRFAAPVVLALASVWFVGRIHGLGDLRREQNETSLWPLSTEVLDGFWAHASLVATAIGGVALVVGALRLALDNPTTSSSTEAPDQPGSTTAKRASRDRSTAHSDSL